MVICESLLITLLLAMLVQASVSDCKNSTISNKLLAGISGPAIAVDLIYYQAFAKPYFSGYIANSLLLVVVGVLFYSFHLWAAGDSKLLFAVSLCIPGRFYSLRGSGRCISFLIVVLIFSLAYLYVVAESVVVGIKRKNLFRPDKLRIDWGRQIISYLSIVSATTLFHLLLSILIEERLGEDVYLATAINFLLVLVLVQIRDRFSTKLLCIWAAISWIVIVCLSAAHIVSMHFSPNLGSCMLVLAIMATRWIAEKYNYQTIPTAQIKAGQILSMATVMRFSSSRVHGLPTSTTEDLRSRLTVQEAESVRRWARSANGQPHVVIVRKIPFAIFIGLGTALFLLIEVVMLWRT